jgi:hypothetical protein
VKVEGSRRGAIAPRTLYFNLACGLATLLFWANFLSLSRTVVWAPEPGTAFPTNALGYDWAIMLGYHEVYHAPLAALRLVFAFDPTSLMGNPQFPVSPLCFVRAVTDPVTFAKVYLLAHVAVGAVGLWLLFRWFGQEHTAAHALAFALVNFNGNFAVHWFVGHMIWVSYFYVPLALYFLVRSGRPLVESMALGLVLAAIFMTGGAHVLTWLLVLLGVYVLLDPLGAGLAASLGKVAGAGLTAAIASIPKLVPVLQTAADYSPPARGGFQDVATLVAALLGHIERTSETIMWWEGASYVSIFPMVWYAKNAGRFGSVAHRRLLVIAGLFAVLSLGGVYPAVFGAVPVLKSQNVTSRLVLMSILVFAAALATGEWNRPGQPRWRDAYLIVMGYVAMIWWTWTTTWNFDTPRF